MQRSLPPFRADHVGSLLRSPRLKDARTRHAAGGLPKAEVTAIENDEIKTVIARQEALGLSSITDGEFRRAYWHFDFLSGLDGVEMVEAEGIKFAGVTSKTGTIENKDFVKRRIDEASRYVSAEQLCLSPQCGFASTEEGNVLAEDEQWAKLRLVAEVADEVWR